MKKNQNMPIKYWVAHRRDSSYIIDSTISPSLEVCKSKFNDVKDHFVGYEDKIEFIVIEIKMTDNPPVKLESKYEE